jgi:hypothetical protein
MYKVIKENGTVLFEGRDQECINYITNNPHLDDIEKVSDKEYSRRFKFVCELCEREYYLKRQREYSGLVVCEYCLNEEENKNDDS